MTDTYYLNFNEKIKANKIGDIFEAKNYTSTNKDISVATSFANAECCLYEIYLSKGLAFITPVLK